MTPTTRVRISIEAREFEIEGSEDFVTTYSDRIEELLTAVAQLVKTDDGSSVPSSESAQKPPLRSPTSTDSEMPETFGEFFHDVPNNASGLDQILVAGYFAQMRSEDNSFVTADASSLLLEQGIRLANPSTSVKRNLDAKYLIQLAKGKYRVSRVGVEHITALRNGQPEK